MSEQLEQLARKTVDWFVGDLHSSNPSVRKIMWDAYYGKILESLTTATADLRREVEVKRKASEILYKLHEEVKADNDRLKAELGSCQTSRRNAYLGEYETRKTAEADNDRLRKALERIVGTYTEDDYRGLADGNVAGEFSVGDLRTALAALKPAQ